MPHPFGIIFPTDPKVLKSKFLRQQMRSVINKKTGYHIQL